MSLEFSFDCALRPHVGFWMNQFMLGLFLELGLEIGLDMCSLGLGCNYGCSLDDCWWYNLSLCMRFQKVWAH